MKNKKNKSVGIHVRVTSCAFKEIEKKAKKLDKGNVSRFVRNAIYSKLSKRVA
jgi:hypothetical protein